MGSLALWGAIGGAAKGAEKGILMKAEDESYAKRAKIDEDRESRMEKLRQSGRMEIQGAESEAAMDRQKAGDVAAMERLRAGGEEERTTEGVRQENRMELESEAAFNREQLQIIDQNWRSVENQLDRESREKIAELSARTSSAAGSKLLDKHLNRYQKSTLTKSQANEYGIVMNESQMPATYDDLEGVWYLQKGNMLFLPNDNGNYEPRNLDKLSDAHLNALYQNPERKGDFLERYGFLPVHFLKAQMISDLNSLQMPTATSPGSE